MGVRESSIPPIGGIHEILIEDQARRYNLAIHWRCISPGGQYHSRQNQIQEHGYHGGT